jgi:DNA-binding GntR family transcriptional regulator
MVTARLPDVTLAQAAYEKLRADLLSCRLLPGKPIQIKEISAQIGINPIAVREALSRLTSEGLVTVERQKGFRAAPLSAASLIDISSVRIEIECQSLRRAIANGGADWEAGIVMAHHRLMLTPLSSTDGTKATNDEWIVYHTKFHSALVSACGSPVLLQIREWLYAQSERYRRLSLPLNEPFSGAAERRDLAREHKMLAEATINRDVEQAVTLMSEHLRKTTEMALRHNLSLLSPDSPPTPAPEKVAT